jgi:sterol desaturase/sphingolipid hydroxylase (fatty acid hydroxylase superfamily)
MLLFERITGLPTFWGAVVGCTTYYAAYEYTHYLMHVPRGHLIERFRWFRFLREHHRLHHRYMLRNFNVLIPLGDICFGTLVTASGRYAKSSRRHRRFARKVDRPVSEH